jgi:hypothetical protein
MQQTILDVLAYWATLALPVRHLMYDSWWYRKECDGASPDTWLNCRGAVELWEPRTDCFPDGFNFKEPLPLALHNRYFSATNNTYVNDLGFAASFIVEKNVDLSLPIKADVFTYMMGKARDWGGVLYEQASGARARRRTGRRVRHRVARQLKVSPPLTCPPSLRLPHTRRIGSSPCGAA